MTECLACHGTYEPIQPDGTRYYHVCPPLAAHEIVAQLDAGTLQLPPVYAAQLAAAKRTDANRDRELKPDELTAVEHTLATFVVARPGHRDENIFAGAVPATDKRAAQPPVIKSEGAGARKLA